MIKLSAHLKNLSRQKIRFYAIYKKLSGEELELHKRTMEATSVFHNMPEDQKNFILNNALVTLVTNKEQLSEYVTCTYLLNHEEHFKAWCPLHGFDPNTDEAASAYITAALETNPHLIDDDLSVCLWCYTADDVARSMRMVSACAPIGCSFENDAEVEYYASNLALGIKAALEQFSEDQLTTLLKQTRPDMEIPSAEPKTAEPTAAPTQEPTKAAPSSDASPSSDAPKKKRGRPKKTQ